MKEYNKLKRNMKIFFITLIIVVAIMVVAGSLIAVFVDNSEYAVIAILIITMVGMPISVIVYNHFFNIRRNKVILDTFNSFEHDELKFYRKNEVGYEALDALNMSNLANEFYISSVVRGKYKGVDLESFSLDFTKDDKRKNEVLARLYIFTFDKNIKDNFNVTEFNSKLIKESDLYKKCKVIDNKLYLSYANPKKKYYFQMEPLAFKDYESFKNRFSEEFNLIDEVINKVEETF